MTKNDFCEMIRRESRKLYGVAYSMVRNQQEAEDIVQNVFIKLWDMKEGLDKIGNISSLALKMTKNSCIDTLRKWKFNYPEYDEKSFSEVNCFSSPHEQMVNKEESVLVMNIISDLPPPYKETILMREVEGLSYNEIATMNEMNINSVRVIVCRARQMIREKYNNYERRKN